MLGRSQHGNHGQGGRVCTACCFPGGGSRGSSWGSSLVGVTMALVGVFLYEPSASVVHSPCCSTRMDCKAVLSGLSSLKVSMGLACLACGSRPALCPPIEPAQLLQPSNGRRTELGSQTAYALSCFSWTCKQSLVSGGEPSEPLVSDVESEQPEACVKPVFKFPLLKKSSRLSCGH